MSKNLLYLILAPLLVALVISVISDIKRTLNPPVAEYKIGDRVIYRQFVRNGNRPSTRLVGGEVIKVYQHKKTGEPYYMLKIYSEEIDVRIVSEMDIECSKEEFKDFPTFNKKPVDK